ncbi:MAG: AEC family transporter [Pseudomonadota bacterium]
MFDIILLLLINIFPLYVIIALGFFSGKHMDVNLPSIATIAIYILAPIVNFGALAQMKFTPEYIALPILFFAISALIGTLSYKVAQKVWKSNTANLVGMSSVTGNTMYFGLPIVLALLGPEWIGVYALLNLGTFLNECGLGYFFGARGQATIKGALLKVARFPVIHAVILGFLYNISGFDLHETFIRYWEYSIGAWVILGMMIIGIALAKQSKLDIDFKLLASLLIPKFVLWPLATFAVILADWLYFQSFSQEVYLMLAVFGSVPLAGNLVAYAATFNLTPEKAAAAVLITTLLAFFTVPLAVVIVQLIS